MTFSDGLQIVSSVVYLVSVIGLWKCVTTNSRLILAMSDGMIEVLKENLKNKVNIEMLDRKVFEIRKEMRVDHE